TRAQATDLRGARRHGARDVIEPDTPGDLLDEVDLTSQIRAERRNDRGAVAHLDPEGREIRSDVCIVEIRGEQLVHPVGAYVDASRFDRTRVRIDRSPRLLRA